MPLLATVRHATFSTLLGLSAALSSPAYASDGPPMGFCNEDGNCARNAALQGLLALETMNQKILVQADELCGGTHGAFMAQYCQFLRLHELQRSAATRQNLDLSFLPLLDTEIGDSFVTFQKMQVALDQAPAEISSQLAITSVERASLSERPVDEALQEALFASLAKGDFAQEILLMLTAEDAEPFTAAQPLRAPLALSGYELIAVVSGCREEEDSRTQSNHAIAYRKIQGQWYVLNDEEVHPRSEAYIAELIASGNAFDVVPGRGIATRHIFPSTLIYRRSEG